MHPIAPLSRLLPTVLRACLLLALSLLAPTALLATTKDGALRMEVIAAPNFVVDSNIQTPAGKSPSAAHLGVRIYNDGPAALTNVRVNIGSLTDASTSTGTPGIYRSRTPTAEETGGLYAGTFSLVAPGGAADSVRIIPRIEPGQYVAQYFFVTYPLLDSMGKRVTGAASVTSDDLWLEYDIWASANDGATRRVNKTSRATMRNELSAMANKILPNTTSKVPKKYLDAIEASLGWRPVEGESRIPGANAMEGIWYDLGNVGQGFDNDGDGIPDRNAWLQPVGDPNLFSPLAARLVKAYGIVIVKLNDGTEMLIPFEDRLYFSNLPVNNTGAVGLVYYEFLPLNASLPSVLTPYHGVASGFNNEKFNGDYGTSVGSVTTVPPTAAISKTGPSTRAVGQNADYTITATNTGTDPFGWPDQGVPVVIEDPIPAGLQYVGGTADTLANVTTPAGGEFTVEYSTNDGATWSATEPDPASGVNRLRWILDRPLAPGDTATVGFSALVPSDFTPLSVSNTGILKTGYDSELARSTWTTTIVGNFSIGDFVWADTANFGVQDVGELGIGNVTVRLYLDLNNNGVIDSGDTLIDTAVTDANGAYVFNSLQDRRYIVAVDTTSAGLVSRFGAGLYTNTTPITKLYATLPASATDADFGFRSFDPGSIGDQVYFDRNGNGTYEPATDLPLANVTVRLLSGGTVIATTSTNLSGEYLFANLAPGTYTVEVDLNDPDIPAYLSAPVASYIDFPLVAGQNDLSRDFRFIDPGNITKQVDLSQLNTPGNLTFTLRPSYTGPLLTNAFVRDTLPAGTTFVSAGQGGTGNPDVIWNLGSNTPSEPVNALVATELIKHVNSNSAANSGGGSTGGSVVVPTGTTQGDLMLLALSIGSSATATVPAGWNLIRNTPNPTVSPAYRLVTYWKAAGASEVDPSFSFGVQSRWSATLSTYRNVDVTSQIGPISVSSESPNAAGTSILATGVTPSDLNTRLVGVFGFDRATSVAVPDGMVSRAATSTNGGQNGSAILIADQAWPTATFTNSRTATTGSPQNHLSVGQLIALRPAASNSYSITTSLSTNSRRLVTGGERITVTLTATAAGNAGTVTAPTNLTLVNATNGVTATKFSGPTPASAPVNNGSATFTYEYDLAAGPSLPGSIRFQGAPTSAGATWGTATSASVLVTPPLTLTVNVASGSGQSTVVNTATLFHNTSVFLGQSPPTVTTLDGSIGDFVWADLNGDGLQAGESGIPGVRVYVDTNGNGVYDLGEPSAITNHLGAYTISGLGAGTYSVRYDLATVPSGFVATTPTVLAVNLAAGEQLTTADFGLQPVPVPGSIGDVVWIDLNGDGVKQVFEQGIAGVTITLHRDLNNDGLIDAGDALVATAITDSSGAYLFTGLPAGNYLVSVDPNDGAIPVNGSGSKFIVTTALMYDVTLTAGQTFPDADFGFAPPGSIGDFVYFDANANGTQDIGEIGIPDVIVQLFRDTNSNGEPDGPAIATTMTADGSGALPAGYYLFTDLPAGTYYVKVVSSSLPTGVVQTADPDRDGVPVWDTSDSTLPPGDHADSFIFLNWGSSYTAADFGYLPPGSIGDFVWLDLNGDGIQDPGEPGIADVIITVTGGGTTFTTTTDFDGYWSIPNVPDGTWTVTATGSALNGLIPTYDAQGAVDGSATFMITNGDVNFTRDGVMIRNLDIDFGYKLNGAYSLAGTIFTNDKGPDDKPGYVLGAHDDIDDFFDDGVDMDAGPTDETELDGITVYLYTSTGTFLGTTVSASGGQYRFTGLPADTYRVIIGTTDPVFANSTLTTTVDNNAATTLVQNTGTSVIQTVVVASDVTAIDFAFIPDFEYDYGDLPLSYSMTTLAQDGARHAIPVGGTIVYLGTEPDAETNGIPSALADGDDRTGRDDEDGVFPISPADWEDGIVADGKGGSIQFGITGTGWLVGWVDWNGDGDFLGPGEMIVSRAVTGNVTVNFDIPDETIGANSQSWLSRFRVFTEKPAFPLFSYTGTVMDGEVEDHLIQRTLLGSIGNLVYNSLTGAGIPGITVELRTSGGALVATQITGNGVIDVDGDGVIDPPGYYRFTGVPEGEYTVTVTTPPANFAPFYDADGIETPHTTVVTLAGDFQHVTADFGYAPALNDISGLVFYDGGDGEFSADDTPAPGIKVQLWTNPDQGPSVQVRETYTNGDGFYIFEGVPTGDYVIIQINAPDSFSIDDVEGLPDDSRIELSLSGIDITGQNFLNSAPPTFSISGTVYHDDSVTNNNVIGPEDIRLPSMLVKLFFDRDGDGLISPGDTEITSMLTNSSGNYSFTGLPAGTYVVQLITPPGAVNEWDAQGSLTDGEIGVVLTDADSVEKDFLIDNYLGSISGTILIDTDGDGVGTNPHEGVTVSLLFSNGDPVLDENDLEITTFTDENGFYRFAYVPPGDYQIVQTVPTGFGAIDDVDEGDLAINGDQTPINVSSGQSVTGQDFVNSQFASIAGNVFNDPDGLDNDTVDGTGTNGLRVDPDTLAPLPGGQIYVNLVNPVTNLVIASIPVNPDGTYLFTSAQGVEIGADYLLILTSAVQTVGTVLNTSTLSIPWISTGENLGAGEGSDGNVNGILAVTTTAGSLSEVNFGVRTVPDVTPVITAFPNIMTGPTPFSLIIRVAELNSVDVDGVVTVRVPKDPRWVLAETYQSGLTLLNGVVIENNLWAYSQNASQHIFQTTSVIAAGQFSTFGIRCFWNSGQTQGTYTITSQVDAGSGNENRVNNNADAEDIRYFIN